MPSRAEVRVWIEQLLRAVVLALLALMLWQSLSSRTGPAGAPVLSTGLGDGLPRWSRSSSASPSIHIRLDSVPSPVERDWLRALSGAGSTMTWSGDLPAVMIDAQNVARPTGGTTVLVAAPHESAVVISDDVGVIDTLRTRNGGAALTLASIANNVHARVSNTTASALLRDSVVLHKVLVVGAAGWESKFVVAALEEEGWKVDALVRVAPSADVTQGTPAAIDTSRYSAVIALDRSASPYARRIVDFVRAGGGVVLGPEAASLDGLADIRAGAVGEGGAKAAARAIPNAGSMTSADLAYTPIKSLRADAAPIERRGDGVAIAGRRTAAGRVIQLGYEDTWRWRMSGGADAVRAHRLWWTHLVSSVAYGPRLPRAQSAGSDRQANQADQAPLAGLVAAIGPSTPPTRLASLSRGSSNNSGLLFAVLAIALVGEVLSRRVRGAA